MPVPTNDGDEGKDKQEHGEPKVNADNDEELLEEGEMDVDAVINLLPRRHQSRIRDAIKNRGDSEDGEDEKNGARERERSPRRQDKEL